MRNLKLYFIFYKTKFLFPLLSSIFALFYTNIISIAVITLLAATILVWFYITFLEDRKKTTLYFYYNLGISDFNLYSFVFFVNFIILIGLNYSVI